MGADGVVERWAPVGFPGFGHYHASSLGRVRNRYGRILSPYRKKNGYLGLHLWTENKKKACRVNRIVASAFLDDWDPELTVDHINHQRDDNTVENLRMLTQQEQSVHRRPHTKRSWLRLEQRALDGQLLATFTTLADAVKAVRASTKDRIVACALGRLPSAHGYVWTTPPHVDLPGEEWKHVSPTVRVSNMGRVLRQYSSGLSTIAVPPEDAYIMDGYPQLHSGAKHKPLHVAVAKLFLPAPDNPAKTMVNHIDGDVLNAGASNLEWVTPSQNTQHAHDTGLLNTKKKVHQYDRHGNYIATYPSVTEAGEAVGICRKRISHVACNHSKSVRGYVWKYDDPDTLNTPINTPIDTPADAPTAGHTDADMM
jgi:hypothetical protein